MPIPRSSWGRRIAGLTLATVVMASACSEPEADDTSPGTEAPADEPAEPAEDSGDEPAEDSGDEPADEPDTTEAPFVDDGSIVAAYHGQEWFLGTLPDGATLADESLEPIKIGMINQEETPLGSFPEVRAAAQAAAAWVNAELGGVDGRPVEIIPCVVNFDPEVSQSCAIELQQAGVVALVGGVDVMSQGAYPVIEQNGLPVVGGIPASLVEQRSPNAFFFSGGGAGAAAAMIAHAAENGAETVALAYGEFEAFEVAARDYAAAVGESLGVTVELVPFSLFATDYLPVLTKAQDVGADAIVLLAADAACLPMMQLSDDLELDARMYLMGSCAAEAITDAAGESVIGVVFNSEGPVTVGDVEGMIFDDVTERYADEPAFAAGTVGFRGFMNLYGILTELGGDNISSENIIEVARSAVDRPSFWGHPYTCDGQQVPGLPALCAPQQVLFEIPGIGADIAAVSGWIPVDELFADAVG